MLPRIFREAGIRHIEKRLEKMATPLENPQQNNPQFQQAQGALREELGAPTAEEAYYNQLRNLHARYMQLSGNSGDGGTVENMSQGTAGISEENAPKVIATPQ